MAIHVIAGRGGSGKSAKIYQLALEHIRAGGKAILLVPEQFTLQAEREILSALGDEGMIDMQVMSITKLMEDVFSRVRSPGRTLIDAKGRALAMKHLAVQHREDFKIFSTVANRSGFATMLQELLGDLKRFDIGVNDINDASSELEDESLTKRKLKDVMILMESFERFMVEGGFGGHEDHVNALIDILPEVDYLREHIIYVDGFDYLPPQNIRLMGALANLCMDVYVSICTAANGQEDALFLTGQANYTALQGVAERYGQRFYTLRVNTPYHQKHPSILHLEQNLYCYPARPYDGEAAISIRQAADSNEEVSSVAGEILRLIEEEGIRYQDVAVLCGNFPQYEHPIRRIFGRYQIPAFLDVRRPVSQHPVVAWLLSALKAAVKQPYRDDVMRLIKSGYAGLDNKECELFEDYCLDNGVQGELFKVPFRRGAARYSLEEMNRLRMKALVPSYSLEEGPLAVKDWISAIVDMIERAGIKKQLDQEELRLLESDQLEIAAETAQAFNVVIETLDQLMELLGDETLSLQEITALLEEAFSAAQVGILPTAPDQVLVGDVGRSKLPAVKYVFVLGANEGALPLRHSEGGILGDRELQVLKDKGLLAGRDAKHRRAESAYSLYEILIKPLKGLYLSYDISGSQLPSMVIERIRSIFPQVETKPCDVDPLRTPAAALYAASRALGALGDGRQPRDGRWKQALSTLIQDKRFQDKIEKMKDFASGLSTIQLDCAQREGDTIISSISQLEEYARCPFAYMVSYGLMPSDDPGEGVDPAGEGAFLHQVMEAFGKRLSNMDDPASLSDQALGAIMEEEASHLAAGFDDGAFLQSERGQYHAGQLVKTARRGAHVYARELRSSDFWPIAHEAGFGEGKDFAPIEIPLPSGEKALLRGKIDRVDKATIEDMDWYRAIDYKSGKKNVDLPGVKSGSDIQLFIYMDALLKGKQKAKSAGVFYFPLRDDYSDEGNDALQSERLKGLMVNNASVIAAMDHNLTPGAKSEVLPIKLKKDGAPAKSASVKDQRYVDATVRAANETAHRLLQDMDNGQMCAKPLKDGKKTACDYCKYRSICGFGAVGYDYNAVPGKEEAEAYITSFYEGETS